MGLPFLALCLAAFARHHSLPFQRGGGVLQSPAQYQQQYGQHPSAPPPLADSTVREGDNFHLPLAALQHGLSDALAWNDAVATGTPAPGTRPPPNFLTRAKASFFFGESNGTTFAALRELYGLGNREYLASLESGFDVFGSNSKSGQFFCFTGDKKFIIKTMSSEELRALTAILGDYHKHMAANPRSLLVHYCGHYHVRLYRYETDEWQDIHFLVMRNLMTEPRPGMVVRELYDVKGSTVGRAASEKDKAKETQMLKDLDMMERPWPIDFGHQKGPFMDQMARDVDFLRTKGVMDYSLLLGICPTPNNPALARSLAPGSHPGFPQRILSYFLGPPSHGPGAPHAAGGGHGNSKSLGGWVVPHPQGREVYIAGVIDVLQLYNRRKQAETLLKSVVYKRDAISAVDPVLYASRFLNFCERMIQQHVPLPPPPPPPSLPGVGWQGGPPPPQYHGMPPPGYRGA